MALAISCKRLLAPYADLLEPLQKRGRLDLCRLGAEDPQDGFSVSSCGIPGVGFRRRHSEDFQEFAAEPAEKRPRLHEGWCGGVEGELGGIACSSNRRRLEIQSWAEDLVRSLQGCSSTEEAVQRTVRVLLDVEAEAQQAASAEREGDVSEASAEGVVQNLQQTKKVLMRAVHHLAQRCRTLEASSAGVDGLRDELERSQESERRLRSANELLREHLRLHLDGRM